MTVGAPTHVGVGGLSMCAARLSRQVWPVGRVLLALHTWLPSIDAEPQTADVVRATVSRRFPLVEVAQYVRGVGLAHLAAEVVERLARIDDLLPDSGQPAHGPNWPLALWLPAVVNGRRQAPSSANSVELLGRLTGEVRMAEREITPVATNGAAADEQLAPHALLAALASDLALIEAQALQWGRPSQPQYERTLACLRLLACLVDLWPTWLRPLWLAIPASLANSRQAGHHAELPSITGQLATHIRRQAGQRSRLVAELAMLPFSTMHDEQLQIRAGQLRSMIGSRPNCEAGVLSDALDLVMRTHPAEASLGHGRQAARAAGTTSQAAAGLHAALSAADEQHAQSEEIPTYVEGRRQW